MREKNVIPANDDLAGAEIELLKYLYITYKNIDTKIQESDEKILYGYHNDPAC